MICSYLELIIKEIQLLEILKKYKLYKDIENIKAGMLSEQ
jgi:hypothetical protein